MIAHGLYNLDPQPLLQLIKSLQEQIKVTIDQLAYCHRSQRSLKNYSMINFLNIWKTNYHHSYVVSGRNIVLNMRYCT